MFIISFLFTFPLTANPEGNATTKYQQFASEQSQPASGKKKEVNLQDITVIQNKPGAEVPVTPEPVLLPSKLPDDSIQQEQASDTNWLNIILGSGVISAIIGLSVTIYVFRKEYKLALGTWSIGNLKPFYFDEYLDQNIKEARARLKGECQSQDDEADKDRISKSIQSVGIMAYLGAIPLSYPMLMNGYQIVSDWLRILEFIFKVRNKSLADDERKKFIGVWITKKPFVRRHAEWIALISYMWIKCNHFDDINEENQKDIRDFGELYGDFVLYRENLLFNLDRNYVAPDTLKLRNKIIADFRANKLRIH